MMGLADTLKVQPDQLSERVARMVAQLKEAEREIASLKSANLLAGLDAITAKTKDMWGIGYIAHRGRRGDQQRPADPGPGGAEQGRQPDRRGLRDRWHGRQAGRGDRHHRGRSATAASRPVSWSPSPPRRSVVGAAARTTSPRAAGPDATGAADRAFTDVEYAIGGIATR